MSISEITFISEVKSVLELDANSPIRLEDSLDQHGIDSISFIELVVNIERVSGKTFDEELLDYSKYKTLQDLFDQTQ